VGPCKSWEFLSRIHLEVGKTRDSWKGQAGQPAGSRELVYNYLWYEEEK